MRYKGSFIIIAKDGWPLEQFENSPIRNFFRRLFLSSHKECRACQPINVPQIVHESPICDICGNRSMDSRFHHAPMSTGTMQQGGRKA